MVEGLCNIHQGWRNPRASRNGRVRLTCSERSDLLAVLTHNTHLKCKQVRTCWTGTSKKKCEHETDYCYNATADLSQLNEISMAGCSTTRCFLSQNACIQQTFLGRRIKFCCCNTGDLCNSKLTVGSCLFCPLLIVIVEGYSAYQFCSEPHTFREGEGTSEGFLENYRVVMFI
ncbi:hypothetical protein Y032_0545g3237 [Ancylostoma ceylanicum]|nr:hypothetical protein Y032_0545g3237 [Ancylostoma ceylanicum]